jgi:hypothetical protein
MSTSSSTASGRLTASRLIASRPSPASSTSKPSCRSTRSSDSRTAGSSSTTSTLMRRIVENEPEDRVRSYCSCDTSVLATEPSGAL